MKPLSQGREGWPQALPDLQATARYVLKEIGVEPLLSGLPPGMLWNRTGNGFLVVTNTSPEPGAALIRERLGQQIWDVREDRPVSEERIKVPGHDFRIFRVVLPGEDPPWECASNLLQAPMDVVDAHTQTGLRSGFRLDSHGVTSQRGLVR